jgi:hypothetical protein
MTDQAARDDPDVQAARLRALIVQSLEEQSFRVDGGRIAPPGDLSKDALRDLHALAVRHRIERARRGLERYEPRLLRRIAGGVEVVPERITPRLVEVTPDSEDELLFRYASLHWSVPVSSGYGRRLRFLVVDAHTDKLIGLIGLGDPVFALRVRDDWVAWDREARRRRLHHVMDAFVLGAVPPYAALLCGKLVALLAASNEVRAAFGAKYGESGARASVILGRPLQSRLALITTSSALGRSSLYRRLTDGHRLLYQSAGFTRGSGEFHFANGLYGAIAEFATRFCEPTAKQERWGSGFRSRREVVRKCLIKIGLSGDWLYHGVQREVFVVPLMQNTRAFLRGEDEAPEWFDLPAERLCAWFRERWLLPRAGRDQRYREFSAASYRLWG